MAKETAEQKLLKLIEKTDAQENPVPASLSANPGAQVRHIADSVRGTGLPALAMPAFLSGITVSFKGWFTPAQEQRPFGLRDFNRILIVAVVVIGTYFSIDFSKGLKQLEHSARAYGIKGAVSVPKGRNDVQLPVFADLQKYIEAVNKRNIFQPFERKVVKTDDERLNEISGLNLVSEQAKSLKLVGVSWFDSSESASAMVENTANGVTYFLRRGEKVNEITVKDIFAESILISFQGEEMEMKL